LTMREIPVSEITELLCRMVQTAGTQLPPDVYQALEVCRRSEPSPVAKNILGALIENADIARTERIPICQDCGIAFVFLEVGQDVHFIGGNLEDAINKGVAKGYIEGFLRKSVVSDPVFSRVNTKDNTPAIIYPRIVPGERLKIKLATKGFGAENQSVVKMLVPADGLEGVKKVVLDAVKAAGPDGCPPFIVGVGIGGSFESSALCAKKAAIRSIDSRNPDPRYAELEDELLLLVNKTGVGPQGLGGKTTALKVNIEWAPTHIGSMPVAVNLNCHAARHVEAEL
jgi:fumarate hydratase subunit alpha